MAIYHPFPLLTIVLYISYWLCPKHWLNIKMDRMTVVPYLDVWVVPDVSNDWSVSATLARWQANCTMLLNSSHGHNQRAFDTSTSASFLKPEFPSIFIYGQWFNLTHTFKVWHKRQQRLGQWIHSAVMQQKRHNGLNVVAAVSPLAD